MKRFRITKNTIAGCAVALLFAALLIFVGCAGWTQQQKDEAGRKFGQIALNIGECGLEGPASTALQTYLANRIGADPATLRQQIESAVLSGLGHDIICALGALGLRGAQVGEVHLADGVPDGGAPNLAVVPGSGIIGDMGSDMRSGPGLTDGVTGGRSQRSILMSRAASCPSGKCSKEELLAAWMLLELEKSGRLKL